MKLFVCLLILLQLGSFASANVIGFDFGSYYFKITLVKPGQPFAIVENTATKRKTDSMITITDEGRIFGIDSFMEMSKYPTTTFAQLQRYVGMAYDEKVINELKKQRFVVNEIASDDRGLIGWQIERKFQNGTKSQEIVYTEELIAQLFKYGKQMSEKQGGGEIKDCVITIPSYYTPSQRRMILDSAEIAGLSVLQLVHENTAAAVMFGIDRLDTEKPVTVLFYNMGGKDTEVSLVRYSTITEQPANKTYEHVEILAETWDENLGGGDLDIILLNMLAEQFNSQQEREGKPDIRENVKAVKRLYKEVLKIKDVLSANKQIQVKIGELADYDGLNTIIERKQFEDKAVDFFDKSMIPVYQVLEKAGLSIDQVDMIELLGGGIRVPKIQEQLQQRLQKNELGVHLNGDEAMCFGSAFIGSNNSASFKVRKVYLTQHPQFEVSIHITPVDSSKLNPQQEQVTTDADAETNQDSENETSQSSSFNYERNYTLYKKSDFLGQRKSISLTYDTNMKIDVFAEYGDRKEQLATFTLNSIDDIAKNDVAVKAESTLPKVTLSFELSRSGLISLTKAEAKIEETYYVEDKPVKPKEPKETKKDSTESSSDSTDSSDAKTEEKPEEPEVVKKAKKRPHTFPIYRIDKEFYGLPTMKKDQIQAAKDRLRWFEKRDEDKAKTDQAKNEYESIIYAMREWLYEDENLQYVGESQKDEMIDKLREGEDWLMDGEGEHAEFQEYNDRHYDFKRKFDSYKTRKNEHQTRDDAISSARQKLNKIEDDVNELAEKKPWITEEQRKEILDRLDDIKKWLYENIEAQKALSLNEDPVLRSQDIEFKLQRLTAVYTRVSSIPKPKPPKEKKAPKNIKIDNITFDGNQGDWSDFIKINNGDSDEDDIINMNAGKPERNDGGNQQAGGHEEDL